MFNLFTLIPILVCLYEVLSLVMPLKIPAWAKLVSALILVSGLTKFMFRRTETGIDSLSMSYYVMLAASVVFNFIVVAVFILLAKDLVFLIWKVLSRSPFPAHNASLFVFSVALVATLYGTYEGLRVPDVKEYDVKIPGLGQEFEGFRVVMLVDIHADILTNAQAVQAVVDRVNSLKPDVVLIPGDFVDGRVKDRRQDLEPLKTLKAARGVFGSTGNHEYYYDYHGWMKALPELGVRMLMNEHVVLEFGDSKLVIAGALDPTSGAHNTAKALEGAPEDAPVILMDHQPRFAEQNAKLGVSLQLSGHTHGGQMPVIYSMAKRANKGYVRGWYDVEGMKLYVSPGTSQWNGFACRIFDPSEITLLTLHAE